jgi:ketosteroid isomerase-like protein
LLIIFSNIYKFCTRQGCNTISKNRINLGISAPAGLPLAPAPTTNEGMSEKQAVLAANDAFYAAFRAADFEAMESLWSRRRNVSVFHPNWPGINTRDAVMESWYRILIAGNPPHVSAIDATAIVTAKTGLVICQENLGGTNLIATNVFVLEDGQWRMTNHQASRLPVTTPQGDQIKRREE